jgi:hypothetical protein
LEDQGGAKIAVGNDTTSAAVEVVACLVVFAEVVFQVATRRLKRKLE